MSAPVIAPAALSGAIVGASLFVPRESRGLFIGTAAQFAALSIYFAAKDTYTTPIYESQKRNTTAVASGIVLAAALSAAGISMIRRQMGYNTLISTSTAGLLVTGASGGFIAVLLPVW